MTAKRGTTMNNTLCKVLLLCVLGVWALAGCSKAPTTDEPQPAATTETAAPTTAGDATAAKKYDPEKVCLTCAAEGDPMEGEELPEKVVYKGQTYRFCSEKCKAEFISDPPKYAVLSSR
jgi:YHS domain-containing protein